MSIEVCTQLAFWKDVTQILAFMGALLFFLYKAVSGYHNVNGSLLVDVRRQTASSSTDFLAVTITFKRGDLGTLVLHDIAARLSWSSDGLDITFEDMLRLSFRTEEEPIARKRIRFEETSKRAPLLLLARGEEVCFGGYAVVPSETPCHVSAVVLARALGSWKISQWRASRVSLPGLED